MLLNEHITNEQLFIWKLVIQHPDFFYQDCNQFCWFMIHQLRQVGIRRKEAVQNRELVINVLSLVTAFCIREKQEKHVESNSKLVFSSLTPKESEETLLKMFNTQLLNHCCMILQISSAFLYEQVNIKRCFLLLKNILTLSPRTPLLLNSIDDLIHQKPTLLTFTESVDSMVLSFVSF